MDFFLFRFFSSLFSSQKKQNLEDVGSYFENCVEGHEGRHLGEGFFGLGLWKSYSGRTLLQDVSLGVFPGEIVGFFGPNGSGKSTTFGLLTGLLSPQKGSIFFKGTPITSWPLYQRARCGLGYVPQESALFQDLTLYENLEGALWFREKNVSKRQQAILSMAQNCGFSHVLRHKASVLSGGERRKADIARLLLMKPDFLLLDEPLAGLDPRAVEDILSLLKNLAAQGLGIFLTEHHIEKITPIVQRGYILYGGKIIAQGPMTDLLLHPEVQRTYLGSVDMSYCQP